MCILRKVRNCAVCGGSCKRVLYRQQFAAISRTERLSGYAVVACRTCGFCFAGESSDQAALDAYYRNMSKYEHQDRSGQETEYDRARFRQMIFVIQPFLRTRQVRILEIGCANGGLLALLKEAGFTDLLGVDPSPRCAAVARDLYGIRVLTANLSNLSLAPRSFDFIILSGVLEHVLDLDQALTRLCDLLAPGGRMYIGVPDASRYAEGEDAPFQEFNAEHINFFGPISLENLLAARGFALRHCSQELMLVGHRTTTPVVHAIFEGMEVGEPVRPVVYDNATEAGLARYIAKSGRADAHIRSTIDALADSGRSIVVWGTGAHTLRLLAATRLKEMRISAFVDSNPRYQGKELNRVLIIAPTELPGRPEPILISSRAFQEEIASQIRNSLNLDNELIRLYDLGEDTQQKV